MSDLVALKDHLDSLVGDDPGFNEVEWATREIERLQSRVNEVEAINGGMRIILDEAEARVEELEREMEVGLNQSDQGIDTVYQENRALEEEIERLRALEIKLKDDIIFAAKKLNEKDARVEELEREPHHHREGDQQDGLHIFTTDQIDAAWRRRSFYKDFALVAIDDVLAPIIVRCEGCAAIGHPSSHIDEDGRECKCGGCDGHGWRIDDGAGS